MRIIFRRKQTPLNGNGPTNIHESTPPEQFSNPGDFSALQIHPTSVSPVPIPEISTNSNSYSSSNNSSINELCTDESNNINLNENQSNELKFQLDEIGKTNLDKINHLKSVRSKTILNRQKLNRKNWNYSDTQLNRNLNDEQNKFKKSFKFSNDQNLKKIKSDNNLDINTKLKCIKPIKSNEISSRLFLSSSPALTAAVTTTTSSVKTALSRSINNLQTIITFNATKTLPITQPSTKRVCKTERTKHKCHSLDKTSAKVIELIKSAKDEADEAIKNHKIFAIFGPYHRLRQALRIRGWVEKFCSPTTLSGINHEDSTRNSRSNTNESKHNKQTFLNETNVIHESNDEYIDNNTGNTNHENYNGDAVGDDDDNDENNDDDGDGDDDDDSDNDSILELDGKPKVRPWEEKDGYYAILSRLVRTEYPHFIWSLKRSQIDFRFLQKDQLVNHHVAAPFTTKVGLCRHLRQLRWIDDRNSDHFFPRCFVLSDEDDRQAFIRDFRFTACTSLIKMVASLRPTPLISNTHHAQTSGLYVENSDRSRTSSIDIVDNQCDNDSIDSGIEIYDQFKNAHWNIYSAPLDPKHVEEIPDAVMEIAIVQCEEFLKIKNHEDLDNDLRKSHASECPWEQFLSWYYLISKMPSLLNKMNKYSEQCQYLCKKLRENCPQFNMDGIRNVWIVKPGAKSRGRGIICHDRLEDILKIIQSSVFLGESRYVIQKYIEKPLLIYKTKFDIRQWFLITDWSPLTIYWYQDCYLRFCSREFTLNNLSEAVHLSNNSIQYKYKNGPRSPNLPEENMWTLEQFQTWLKEQDQLNQWYENIQPSMKHSVINALLCAQELISVRKNCFALYGADFLLSDDYKLWLIEINASPCMAPSTSVTATLTSNVLEDTLKVVLDKRHDRNCDIGRFELIYRQLSIIPTIYTGIDLCITGIRLSKSLIDNSHITNLINTTNKQSLNLTDYHSMDIRLPKSVLVKRNSEPTSKMIKSPSKPRNRRIKPTNSCRSFVKPHKLINVCNPTSPKLNVNPINKNSLISTAAKIHATINTITTATTTTTNTTTTNTNTVSSISNMNKKVTNTTNSTTITTTNLLPGIKINSLKVNQNHSSNLKCPNKSVKEEVNEKLINQNNLIHQQLKMRSNKTSICTKYKNQINENLSKKSLCLSIIQSSSPTINLNIMKQSMNSSSNLINQNHIDSNQKNKQIQHLSNLFNNKLHKSNSNQTHKGNNLTLLNRRKISRNSSPSLSTNSFKSVLTNSSSSSSSSSSSNLSLLSNSNEKITIQPIRNEYRTQCKLTKSIINYYYGHPYQFRKNLKYLKNFKRSSFAHNQINSHRNQRTHSFLTINALKINSWNKEI